MKFSIIIPVYNRPSEVEELLASLATQTYTNFETLIIEDGSDVNCKQVCEKYQQKLDIKYFTKPNSGPGLSRNYGAERANGDYYIFFDSDCVIPSQYLEIVNSSLSKKYVDAYGGPDMAHASFTPLQKAINYSMTSFFTTGGIRGGKERMDKFHPRSFNMGISPKVFERTKGFSKMRFGEDVDMSLRIIGEGFSTALIPDAAVYHKRRTDFRKFFKQVFNSGIARINLHKRHPGSLKIVHFLPAVFLEGSVFALLLSLIFPSLLYLFLVFSLLLFFDSLHKNKDVKVAVLSVFAGYIQLYGYGSGFWKAFWLRIIRQKDEFAAYEKTFYD